MPPLAPSCRRPWGHPRFPHYAERRSLSDSKCWNGVNKWVKNRLSGIRDGIWIQKYLQSFWTKDVNAKSLGSLINSKCPDNCLQISGDFYVITTIDSVNSRKNGWEWPDKCLQIALAIVRQMAGSIETNGWEDKWLFFWTGVFFWMMPEMFYSPTE